MLLAIGGIDGSAKRTQTRLLVEWCTPYRYHSPNTVTPSTQTLSLNASMVSVRRSFAFRLMLAIQWTDKERGGHLNSHLD